MNVTIDEADQEFPMQLQNQNLNWAARIYQLKIQKIFQAVKM